MLHVIFHLSFCLLYFHYLIRDHELIDAGLLLAVEHAQRALGQRAHLLLAGHADHGRDLADVGGDVVAEELLIGHAAV